jgi:hypothetical protein
MRRRGERGETLAEVLVSTTLLGIIGVGIIGAIATVLISSDIDRRVSAGETVLRSYVSAIEEARYGPCADPSTYSSDSVNYHPPPPFTARVTDVRFPAVTPPGTRPQLTPVTLDFPRTSCRGDDSGLQLVSVEIHSTGARQTTERVSFVKRDTGRP